MLRSLLLFLFTASASACFSQPISRLEFTRMSVESLIRKGDYTEAIRALESVEPVIKSDTSWSELMDCLGNLYLLNREWNKICELYSDHVFKKGEDSTLLVLAKAYRNAPPMRIGLQPTSIPFKPSISGTPVIEVKVNGKVFHFWVDTGAGMSVLTSSTAKKCGVKILGAGASATAATGISVPTRYAVIDSLRTGGLSVTNLPCLILENKQLEFRLLGIRIVKIDGIIGWNLLQELSVTLEQKTKLLKLDLTAGSTEKNKTFFWMGVPLFDCSDSLGKPLLFTFDSGANISAVYPTYYPKADTSQAKRKKVTLGSAGGKRTIRSLTFPRIVIHAGGQTIVMKKVGTDPPLGEGWMAPDGVLGINVLSRYDLYFDLRAGRMELKQQ